MPQSQEKLAMKRAGLAIDLHNNSLRRRTVATMMKLSGGKQNPHRLGKKRAKKLASGCLGSRGLTPVQIETTLSR